MATIPCSYTEIPKYNLSEHGAIFGWDNPPSLLFADDKNGKVLLAGISSINYFIKFSNTLTLKVVGYLIVY